MDISLLIKQRLSELGLEQKDLAVAAEVTESYISQLLVRRKAPPAPERTEIYEKIGRFLKLPTGQLSKLAESQRLLELKKRVAEPPRPLFEKCRELILRKCKPDQSIEVGRIFEKEAFGELERLVTQKFLDVAQELAREELRSEEWLRLTAELTGHRYEHIRVVILEFLDADVFHVSIENCAPFLDSMIDSWNIELKTFRVEIVMNPRLAPGRRKRFGFVEIEDAPPPEVEAGFEQFLEDPSLSSDAPEEEIEFLKTLNFKMKPLLLFVLTLVIF